MGKHHTRRRHGHNPRYHYRHRRQRPQISLVSSPSPYPKTVIPKEPWWVRLFGFFLRRKETW